MAGPDHTLAGHILRNMANMFPGHTERVRMTLFAVTVLGAVAGLAFGADYFFSKN